MTRHPTTQQLAALAADDQAVPPTHLRHCLPCEFAVRRLREGDRAPEPSLEVVEALAAVSPIVAACLLDDTSGASPRSPLPGQVWRVTGPQEGALAWVRRIVSPLTIDVVPLSLDVEMADAGALLLPSDTTRLSVPLAAFADLHSHLPASVFTTLIEDRVELGEDVQAVLAETTPPRYLTGSPITSLADPRLEYRAILKDILAELSSLPLDASPGDVTAPLDLEEEILSRIDGVVIRPVTPDDSLSVLELRPRHIVSYLDTAVLTCEMDASLVSAQDLAPVISSCHSTFRHFPDVDSLALFAPHPPWIAHLFTRSDLTEAIGVPSGATCRPAPSLTRLALPDILFKHLEGRMGLPWTTVGTVDVDSAALSDLPSLARTIVTGVADRTTQQASRSRAVGKREGYTRAVNQMERVLQFVDHVHAGDLDAAFEYLGEIDT